MNRILGIVAGVVIGILAFRAFQNAADGWGAGHSDIGLWYAIIAGFLMIAAVAAIVGTILHTRVPER